MSCVAPVIEGFSAQAVHTVELDYKQEVAKKLLQTLLPGRVRAITDIQRATLHVIAGDLDGEPERHDTLPIVCLSRTSSFNSVRRPAAGADLLGPPVDLSHYYGAWATPYDEEVNR
ncbi:hypothetical protein [Aquisphaera insulae]|uniref:hypothetical protein n=1 Tax=Aquisphaera insulae TaxID=2712864 RepID=UPI0013E9E6FB|nr:hypothetical protein [Aquisphaera insulae]